MKISIQSLKHRWHDFWIIWHETKHHYYGSHWHEKRKLKHEQKLSNLSSTETDILDPKPLDQDKNTEILPSETASSLEKISKSPQTK
jgi:hypothetical protein